jgi:hypothetical protein
MALFQKCLRRKRPKICRFRLGVPGKLGIEIERIFVERIFGRKLRGIFRAENFEF